MRKEPDTYTGNSLKSVIVSNAFSVASARRDERESPDSRTGGETTAPPVSFFIPRGYKILTIIFIICWDCLINFLYTDSNRHKSCSRVCWIQQIKPTLNLKVGYINMTIKGINFYLVLNENFEII